MLAESEGVLKGQVLWGVTAGMAAVVAIAGAAIWWRGETTDSYMTATARNYVERVLIRASAIGSAPRVLAFRELKRTVAEEGKSVEYLFEVDFKRAPAQWTGTTHVIDAKGIGTLTVSASFDLRLARWDGVLPQRPRMELYSPHWLLEHDDEAL